MPKKSTQNKTKEDTRRQNKQTHKQANSTCRSLLVARTSAAVAPRPPASVFFTTLCVTSGNHEICSGPVAVVGGGARRGRGRQKVSFSLDLGRRNVCHTADQRFCKKKTIAKRQKTERSAARDRRCECSWWNVPQDSISLQL